jgi:hypothetical protein
MKRKTSPSARRWAEKHHAEKSDAEKQKLAEERQKAVGWSLGEILLGAPWVVLGAVIFVGLAGALIDRWILGRPLGSLLGEGIAAGVVAAVFLWGWVERQQRRRRSGPEVRR